MCHDFYTSLVLLLPPELLMCRWQLATACKRTWLAQPLSLDIHCKLWFNEGVNSQEG
jgi:hypothetical protein